MERSFVRRLRAAVSLPILGAIGILCRLTPWRLLQRLGNGLGGLAWRWSSRDRTRALDHLALAYPESSPEWRRATAREAFSQQLLSLLECFHLAGAGATKIDRRIDVEGWEHVEAARAQNRPLMIVTGHCGNWELLGAVFGRRNVPLAAVVRSLSEKQLEPLVEKIRRSFGTRTIHRGRPDSVRSLLGALRGGTALIMLIDQDIRTDGVWVPFFNRLAHTPAGAARLAIRRRAVTLPAFMERQEDGNHVARFGEPLELPDDPVAATAVMTAAIEAQVRRKPTQWVWWHRRWRTAPPLGDDERVYRAGTPSD